MTNIPEQINLGALASVVAQLCDTCSWLSYIDYPGVGTAMASCEAGINAINDLIDLACRDANPQQFRDRLVTREAIEDMRSKWRKNPAMPAHQRLIFDHICDLALAAIPSEQCTASRQRKISRWAL